jgi:hypothetical protein
MDHRIQIVAILGAAGLLLFVLELVRRRRLLERYALVWLFSAAVLLGLALWRNGLARLAETFGIAYAPNALFFVAFAFVLVLLLHFSAAVSRLADQSKVLAQRLALLEERLREQEEHAGGEPAASHHANGETIDLGDADVIEPVGVRRSSRR